MFSVILRASTILIILASLIGCKESSKSITNECVVCVEQLEPDAVPYVECGSIQDEETSMLCNAPEGEEVLCESIAACCARAPVGSLGCTTMRPPVDNRRPIVNQSLASVPGQFVFSAEFESETHLFSLDRSSEEIFQLSREAGNYIAVSLGPDRSQLLYSKMQDGLASVWLLDMASGISRQVSPEGCDAGRGGVGWFNDAFVGFAMKCPSDAFRQAFLGNIFDENERSFFRQLTNHEGDVEEVYPILNTTFFLYSLLDPACESEECTTRSTIWIGDNEITEQQCAITTMQTDENRPERTITGPRKRQGDFKASISPNLETVYYSRVVGAKPEGPQGHHDIWSTTLNIRALTSGSPTCAGSMPQSLTQTLTSERWIADDGTVSILSERFPTVSFDSAVEGVSHVFVGRTQIPNTDSALFEVAVDGSLERLTPSSVQVIMGGWIQSELNLSGTR